MKLFERYDPSKVNLEAMEESEYLKMMEDIKKAIESPDHEEVLNGFILDDLVSRQIVKSSLNSCEYFINPKTILRFLKMFLYSTGRLMTGGSEYERNFATGYY